MSPPRRVAVSAAPSTPTAAEPAHDYVVVARRYRPQTFEALIGQQHVARALSGAIETNRVGHAYLFTGARGVGKTSAARILAKALDCEQGPTATPCNQCDICQSISSGDDVDVLEIDGASNRGIDEMRELRQNVNVRPSRARFKIYIIDEVHMLTREAFNALLKTLEEPPEHVKFIFCTTEPEKIPVTILSRCQRFDFAGIQTPSIVERLQQIVSTEGVRADQEALEILARRAAGSMRDSQSLLEQLLSFGGERIGVADVHRMLGTAGTERLDQLAQHLIDRQPAQTLAALDTALAEGVDVGQLLDQLLGYFRDCMAAAVGCTPDQLLYVSSGQQETVLQAGRQLGLETVLAVMQILDQTLSRFRYSTHRRTLAELALVRICKLEDLEELPALIGRLQSGLPLEASAATSSRPRPISPDPRKKKSDAAARDSPEAALSIRSATPLTAESVPAVWSQAMAKLPEMLADMVSHGQPLASSGPNRLVVTFQTAYTIAYNTFRERPDHASRLEKALSEVTGSPVRVEFALQEDGPSAAADGAGPIRAVSHRDRLWEKSQHPLVRKAVELFDGRPTKVEEPNN